MNHKKNKKGHPKGHPTNQKEKGLAVGRMRGLTSCGAQRQNRTADTRIFRGSGADGDSDNSSLRTTICYTSVILN